MRKSSSPLVCASTVSFHLFISKYPSYTHESWHWIVWICREIKTSLEFPNKISDISICQQSDYPVLDLPQFFLSIHINPSMNVWIAIKLFRIWAEICSKVTTICNKFVTVLDKRMKTNLTLCNFRTMANQLWWRMVNAFSVIPFSTRPKPNKNAIIIDKAIVISWHGHQLRMRYT